IFSFFSVLSYIYSNFCNQQKMHCFYKRYKSSRQYSRHVLKIGNYFTPESRFDMTIRTLETLIYDCPNSTSNGPPQNGPPQEKTGLKSWGGRSRSWGGQDPPTPPVVAPLGTTSYYQVIPT